MNVDIQGLDNVPRDGGLITAMNHTAFLDPLLVISLIGRDVIPMAKIELLSTPFIGWWSRWYGVYFIRRGEGDIGAFKTSLQMLKQGEAINIAVEGHRSEAGTLQQGKEGTVIIAQRSGAAILPIAIWGSRDFKNNYKRLRRTDIHIRIAEPVVVALGSKANREELQAATDELMLIIAEMMPIEWRGYYAAKTRTNKYFKNNRPATAVFPSGSQKEVIQAM
jgi:1-acyl-sn-glycerol-3-phosphate acyltransferase